MKQLLKEVEASVFADETEISPSLKLLISQLNKTEADHRPTEWGELWMALDNVRKRIRQESQANVLFLLHLFEELLPSLEDEELFLTWTTYYLKYAVDSAGVHFCIVNESRRLIMNIILPSVTADANRRLRRNSVLGIQLLVDVYLLKIDLVENFDCTNPQEYEERLRFVKSNCKNLLQSLSLGKQVLMAINEVFLDSNYRFECLVLFSSLMPSSALLYQIKETNLLNNLLLSMLIDKSNILFESGINVLSMILPHVCDAISDYLPTVMAILSRSVGEFEIDESTLPLTWNVFDKQTAENNDSVSANYKKLFTVLYGLFPLNLSSFIHDPNTYIGSNKIIENLKFHLSDTKIKSKCQELFQSFLAHPNFFAYSSREEEILDTSRWEKMQSPDEIAAFCYDLGFFEVSKDIVCNTKVDDLLEGHRFLYLKDVKDAQKEKVKRCEDSFCSVELLSDSRTFLQEDDDTIKEKHSCKHVAFYVREILLAKNELDFTLHLNHLLRTECDLLRKNLKEMISVRDQNRLLTDINEALRIEQMKATEQITRLIEERDRTQNEFKSSVDHLLKQSNELKEREFNLVKIHQSNDAEIGDLNHRLEKLCNTVQPRELEIEQLKKQLRIALNPLEQTKSKTLSDKSTIPPYQLSNVFNIKLERSELHSRIKELQTKSMKLKAENEVLKADLERSKKQSIEEASNLNNTMKGLQKEEFIKNKLKINDIVYNYEFKNQELQILIRELHNKLREKDMKLSQLTTTQPINIPRSAISIGKPNSPGQILIGDANSTVGGVYSRKPPTFDPAPNASNTAPFSRQKYGPSKILSKDSAEQVVKGRGGFQKRKLKM